MKDFIGDFAPGYYPDANDRTDGRVDFGPIDDAREEEVKVLKGSCNCDACKLYRIPPVNEISPTADAVPRPSGNHPPRDSNPSAECQLLRERVATLRVELFALMGRAASVAQWADGAWADKEHPTGFHPAFPDVVLLRKAIDKVVDSCVFKDAGPSDGGATPREEVRWFAERMERKLRANDHKGGWRGLSFADLMGRLRIELNELDAVSLPSDVIEEAADVANYAMMIADKALQALRDRNKVRPAWTPVKGGQSSRPSSAASEPVGWGDEKEYPTDREETP